MATPVDIAALGQEARLITDFQWDPAVDLSSFQGSVRLEASEEVALIVILVRPDQFATLPVSKQLSPAPDRTDQR